jgi:polyhydroxybutyrate depolymerase
MKRPLQILLFLSALALVLAACKSSDSGTEPELELAIPITPGRHDLSVTADGVTRWFIYYIPASYNASRAVPLIIALHGGGGGMHNMWETRDDLIALSDQKGFILTFPNGQNESGNKGSSTWKGVYCCGYAFQSGKSDVAFIDVLVDTLQSALAIDPKRIHALGFSNGGHLAHRLAAERPNRFASVASMGANVAGESPLVPLTWPSPTAPIPIMLMHGMEDDRAPYNGGTGAELPNIRFASFAEGLQFWAANSRCGATPDTTVSTGGMGKIFVTKFAGCAAEVIGVSAQNVKHGWLDVLFAGFDGTAQAVSFFETHPKP